MIEHVGRRYIFSILNEFTGKDKLDIGAGMNRSDCLTLDKSDLKCTFTGDIRTMFAPVYRDKQPRSLKKMQSNSFRFIEMQHIVEHIEWIYQKYMFDWVLSLLKYDGILFIETPNVEVIINQFQSFTSGLSKQHPDIKEDDPNADIKWLNFKLYSGCSTNKVKNGCTDGDFHLCMYNKDWLCNILLETGFKHIKINEEETLSCLAYKEWKDYV